MLVPLRIVARDPKGLGTADSPGVCTCEDTLEYAMKDGSVFPSTPHDEWFCTRLAEAVGIACPPPFVLQTETGELIFGSRWEGGVTKDPWWDMLARGDMDIKVVGPLLSRIFAFDCFVHNDDRHLNNYLARSIRNGWALLAMDFSRAWLSQGFPLPPLPFSPQDRTLQGIRVLDHMFPGFFDQAAANALLDRLQAVSAAQVELMIQSHPPEWISAGDKESVIEWWKSDDRARRIEAIRKGIADGTFL